MFKKIMKAIEVIALVTVLVLGLGVLVCAAAQISIVWAPVLGPVATVAVALVIESL